MTPFRYNSRSIHVLAESCQFPHVTAHNVPKSKTPFPDRASVVKGRRPFRAERRTLFRKTSQWVILALSMLAELLLALIMLAIKILPRVSELVFFSRVSELVLSRVSELVLVRAFSERSSIWQVDER